MATIYDVAAYAGVSPKRSAASSTATRRSAINTRQSRNGDCGFGLYPVFGGTGDAVEPLGLGRTDYWRHLAHGRTQRGTRAAGHVF